MVFTLCSLIRCNDKSPWLAWPLSRLCDEDDEEEATFNRSDRFKLFNDPEEGTAADDVPTLEVFCDLDGDGDDDDLSICGLLLPLLAAEFTKIFALVVIGRINLGTMVVVASAPAVFKLIPDDSLSRHSKILG